jgi:hypothetical protein
LKNPIELAKTEKGVYSDRFPKFEVETWTKVNFGVANWTLRQIWGVSPKGTQNWRSKWPAVSVCVGRWTWKWLFFITRPFASRCALAALCILFFQHFFIQLTSIIYIWNKGKK